MFHFGMQSFWHAGKAFREQNITLRKGSEKKMMNYDQQQIFDYLRRLLAIPSPSGYTGAIMQFLGQELAALGLGYSATRKGALLVTLPGLDDERQRTLTAHTDTLGAMVKAVKPGGTLALAPIGGFMMTAVEGANCTVVTLDGTSYSGTIQTIKPSVHISGDDARELKRTPENMEVVLDEKVFSKEDTARLGIEVGDFICIDPRTVVTERGFIKSRYLDDKAGVAVLLYVLRHITENGLKLSHTTHFYLSNYEEVGHGACAAVPAKTQDYIGVDMGAPGVEQNSSEYSVCICAKDSSGPYDFELRKELVEICKRHAIPYRIDVYPRYSSDASAALRAGWDIRTALVGPGVFASHAYERTHIDSIVATIELLLRYLTVA
ncbi:putative aminopeptidase FrvX [Hydrogenispora ethanolica]|uniref:Putative aminopeptidase FrvX n=2 Tax=Hydrogenispora ethanolica TaxID=1082276 RepID=A0A4V2QFD9_HYDET|nr:putative aminopeptidase FrvX [Hydrogenispora ethanolica]